MKAARNSVLARVRQARRLKHSIQRIARDFDLKAQDVLLILSGNVELMTRHNVRDGYKPFNYTAKRPGART